MRIYALFYVFFAILLSNCASSFGTGPVSLNYEPRILTTPKKGASKALIALIQVQNANPTSTFNNLKSQGKILFGESRFRSAFNNYNLAAKHQAELIGADSIVVSFRKVGTAKGDRMIVSAKTDPTVGVTTSNVFGSMVSSASTPYGSAYGTSSFNGTGFSTTYNPGQTLYTRQEYTYDDLEYVFSFWGIAH